MLMTIRHSHYIFILLIIISEPLFAQKGKYSDYYLIKSKYEFLPENDPAALPLINQYLSRAKKEKQYDRMVEGYLDGIEYSRFPGNKLKYADSAVWAAKRTHNDSILSRAYLQKGIVYYFNFKKYKLALNEYLNAYAYSKRTADQYHKHRLAYLIGVVKSYIGEYDEALPMFKETVAFFESESKKEMHPNLKYGIRRGYLNSIHQMIVCNRNLGSYKLADSLIDIGISTAVNNKTTTQEYGYFLKERGIREYREKKYTASITSLKNAVSLIADVNDFAWTTVCYSYIGKNFLQLDETDNEIMYLQKVDSVFQKHNFILPELRSGYELLIDYYKTKSNTEKELYYTKQLLKADEILSKDFAYLSSKIHREYDTKTLLESRSRLERRISQTIWVIWLLATFTVAMLVITLLRIRNERRIREQYKHLEQKILNRETLKSEPSVMPIANTLGTELDMKIVDDILLKLARFEQKDEFVESGLTLNKLASKFNTNNSYLSQIINEYKGTNFNRYLSELRIAYITDKLYNDRKYLHYKIETLAEECGIASRTNFSNLFQEFNGMRPTDFIKKRLENTDKHN
ncbi:hypothetical protein ATE47_01420 [Chryseobacterium sp. IHB B 17019]|uniref:AraC family transcriptional regulator n=1 Tax=Chryseobacterium sp. IHB B 17019 TaxID=1721091 RepID=UPI000722D353|nr:AraC family transcriptional regulator [Chryseobacterium sp. IHB B 17019]ALR29272.1 hypothetical protein ATE47_01420 [Chryseobacterium sp. IHB B 17019]